MKEYTVGDLLNQLSVLRDENRGLKAAAAGAAAITEKALERLQRAQALIDVLLQFQHCTAPFKMWADVEAAIKTYEESRPC